MRTLHSELLLDILEIVGMLGVELRAWGSERHFEVRGLLEIVEGGRMWELELCMEPFDVLVELVAKRRDCVNFVPNLSASSYPPAARAGAGAGLTEHQKFHNEPWLSIRSDNVACQCHPHFT